LGDAELPGLGETASVLLGGMELQLPRICQHCYSVYCAPLAVEARAASAAFEPRDTKPSVVRPELAAPPSAHFALEWPEWTNAPSRERDWCPSCQKTADLEPCKGEDGFVYWGCRQCGHPRSTPTGPGRAVRVEHGLRCQLVEMGPEVFWADEQTRRWLIEEDDARGVPATEQHLAGLLLVLARRVADRNQWVGLRTTIEQALVHVHFADRAEEGKEYPS
jgi:hypothetical protein